MRRKSRSYGEKNMTGSTAFGAKSATSNDFGQSTFGVSTPNTESLFGNTSQPTGSGLFGQTSSTTFGVPASTSTGTFGFGATPTSVSLFGNSSPSTQSSTQSLFGTSGFGATPTSGSLFGNSAPSTQSSTQSLFGTSDFATTTPIGTTLKFNPPTGTDVMMKGGVSASIGIRLECITCMKEYENKSLEELRVEDYAANRKGGTTGGIKQDLTAFGAKSATSNVFGQSTFGVSTPNTGSLFGNTSQPTDSGLFGQTSSTTFGAPALTSTGTFGSIAFGVKSFTSNVFGQSTFGVSTPNTGSLFGNTSQPTGSGLFGQISSTTFGAPASTSTGTFGNKCVSCAIQTDISETDTKDPKDQDLPFLHTKDVTVLTESMKELFIKSSDHDVKITVKDKQFQAHRIILRTRSPVFAMMLTHDSEESITGTIKIEDCDPDSFDEFLLYLYSGRVENLTPTKALHLYYTADKYDIPALKERCAILLKSSLSVESICDVVLLAKRYDEKELLEEATKFFAQNLREILVTVNWQKFLSNNPIEGNELYIKSLEFFIPKK